MTLFSRFTHCIKYRAQRNTKIIPPIYSLLSAALLLASAPHSATAVSIAQVGSGTDPDNPNSRLELGFDFVNDDDVADDETSNQEGANLTLLLLNAAPQSKVVPLKTTSPGTGYDVARGDAALEFILSRPDIKVIDYDYLQPASLDLLRQAVTNGKVIVMQAGDSGQNSPTNQARTVPLLNGGGIIVGGVDGNNQIDPQSNRAGDLRQYYLVADNSGANGLSSANARARVSAAAAQVFEEAPYLTAQQLVDILLESATDLGARGVDAVYGHGALDIEQALGPMGIGSIDTDGGSNSGGGSGAIAAIALAGALGYALFGRSTTLQKTLIMDKYGRGYSNDLLVIAPFKGDETLQELLQPTPLPSNSLMPNRQHASVDEQGQLRSQASLQQMPQKFNEFNLASHDATDASGNEPVLRFSYLHDNTLGNGLQSRYLLNQPLSLSMGVTAPQPQVQNFNLGSTFSSPYLGFSSEGSALKLAKAGQHGVQQFGFALNDEQTRHGAVSRSVVYEGILDNERSQFGLQVAYLNERGSVFGGASNGPMSVRGAQTLSLTLSGAVQITDKVQLIGQFSAGKTKVQAAKNSLLTGFSSLSSQASAIGLMAQSIFSSDDALAVVVNQPLHLTDGRVDLHTPTQQQRDGSVLFEDESLNLNGLSAPINRLSIRYDKTLGNKVRWSNQVVTQRGAYRSGREQDGSAHTTGFLSSFNIDF